jgi:hypothetical protein
MAQLTKQLKLQTYRNVVLLFVALVVLCHSHSAAAQASLEVTPAEAAKHIVHRVAPNYPMMAFLGTFTPSVSAVGWGTRARAEIEEPFVTWWRLCGVKDRER